MPFWQTFTEETTGIHNSRSRMINVHCRPYNTLQEARDGILEYEAYDYRRLTVYVVNAKTSEEVFRLVGEVERGGMVTSYVALIHKAEGGPNEAVT